MYNELPPERLREVEEALQHDPDLAARCADLLLAQRALDRVRREPRPETSEAILRYSRTFLAKS
ncbi:hypothetical protein GCM10023185_37430 [Hymenobacter saemangeumensis]|uniref:Uncharacterized protein n=1 Tax=Hymenobacter saemangeumensis TaxID=1084522 RepID=A0ABP8IQ66_9BACT